MSPADRIVLQDLKLTYGPYTVLDIDHHEFELGIAHAIVGPNGAGKTTLLRILAKVLQPSGGSVLMPDYSIGYMPQRPYVMGFSVFKNVAMSLGGKGYTKSQVEDAVGEALEAVGMQDMAGVRGHELSGGEAQRVALARLLAAPFKVLLLDEPTSAMDIRGTIAVEQALTRYLQRNDTTLIMTTHAPSQALRVTQVTTVLVDGFLAEVGPTQQVLSDPQDDRVREFLSYWRI